MAKAKRNLTQLRKDNRTSNMPVSCTTKGCTCDAAVTYPDGKKRRCGTCLTTPKKHYNTRQRKNVELFKSLGLL